MGDLADVECVVPFAIRCPGHLCGDAEFGQITPSGDLAGIARSGTPPPTAGQKIRLPGAGPDQQDPAMPTNDTPLPPTTTATLTAPVQQQPGRPRRHDFARP
ncbi:hypothetical protein JCM4814A_45940 [Streptomyces phaeofaciens JCM 4814]|uniref:Uncharacterized protein n=1 Tax=Streptomyces phaeofaciens TaxID=68254 RepID=A0A918LNR6_9ACTN|nr:hypothetical protein GCM10010226_02620 [Streptomyces phaeofaciens]